MIIKIKNKKPACPIRQKRINADDLFPYQVIIYLLFSNRPVFPKYTVLTFGAGNLNVGAYFSLGVDRLNSYNMNVTTFLVGPMSSVRYSITDSFDIFGKVMIGYVGVQTSDSLVNSYVKGSHFGGGAYVGGTWYFSPKMGVGGEIGYGGPTLFGVHLTFKI